MIKHLNPCNNSAPAAFGCPYEEWKLSDRRYVFGQKNLSDVPMRNGNLDGRKGPHEVIVLSDVPMRNGNGAMSSCPGTICPTFGCPYEEWKLLNESQKPIGQNTFGCPYEEWKLHPKRYGWYSVGPFRMSL